jgi:hypothetical protein
MIGFAGIVTPRMFSASGLSDWVRHLTWLSQEKMGLLCRIATLSCLRLGSAEASQCTFTPGKGAPFISVELEQFW